MSKAASAGYPSDVTDEEWEFVLPYLLLCRENSPQRQHDLRQVFNGVRPSLLGEEERLWPQVFSN